MKKVIIDVDTGIDDALALILAINSKKFDIKGITTVSGNVPVDFATKNTLKVLELMGEKDIRVYRGCNKPLSRDIVFKEKIHGKDGLSGQLKDLDVVYKNGKHAVDFLIDEVNKNPGEISLIMLAPLTNLAKALEKDSSIYSKIKEIYIMGGVVKGRGNETPVAEFNFYTDPEAAHKVLNSGIPIKLIGLDVSRKAYFTNEDLKRIENNSELNNFIINILSAYMDRVSVDKNNKVCLLHDPLAIAVAIDEGIVKMEEYYVDVEYSSRLSDGQSICDFNNIYGKKPNVKIALGLDRNKFMDIFMSNINI